MILNLLNNWRPKLVSTATNYNWKTIIDKYPLINIKEREPEQPVGKGWLPLLDTMFFELTQLIANRELQKIEVNQIKEKFGTLRVYLSVHSYEKETSPETFAKYYGIVERAETISATTCQICGEHGKARSGGWRVTLCDKHWELHNSNKEECWKEAYE